MPRFELPPELPPEERQAVLAAMERYFQGASVRPSPWALAGRTEALGLGALQIRFQSDKPWTEIRLNPYTRRGADPRSGRGDSR
jgi:hypothetical protein